MKRLLLGAAIFATCSSAMAQSIGVSVAWFDDNFLTSMRQAMEAEAQSQAWFFRDSLKNKQPNQAPQAQSQAGVLQKLT